MTARYKVHALFKRVASDFMETLRNTLRISKVPSQQLLFVAKQLRRAQSPFTRRSTVATASQEFIV